MEALLRFESATTFCKRKRVFNVDSVLPHGQWDKEEKTTSFRIQFSSLGMTLYKDKMPLVLVSQNTCCLGKLQGACASDMTGPSKREVPEYSLYQVRDEVFQNYHQLKHERHIDVHVCAVPQLAALAWSRYRCIKHTVVSQFSQDRKKIGKMPSILLVFLICYLSIKKNPTEIF